MKAITLYGIAQCDTVKKARKFLEEHAVAHQFHDFRQHSLTLDLLQSWQQAVSWEVLLNKRSTTWKNLEPSLKHNLNPESALQLMLQHPTLIKRPVLFAKGEIKIGFVEEEYKKLLVNQ